MSKRYPNYDWLEFSEPAAGVLQVTMPAGDTMGSVDESRHNELSRIWLDADEDEAVRAILLTGEGKSFSAGGDFEMIDRIRSDFDVRARMWKDGRDLVYNMVNCTKPVVAAIGGPAVGAGLVVALLADIPVAAESSFLMDGHTRLGVAAGDHAAIIWPLLCGMAKSKYYLMLCDRLSAKEAEEMGLIAKCFSDEALYDEALNIATRLSDGPRWAIGWTKHALNGWLRMAMPTFDSAMALEIMGFTSPEAEEGLASLREKRPPDFRTR